MVVQVILSKKNHQRVSKVLENWLKADFEKHSKIFLEQIEKQRTMCLQNLQLTPKSLLNSTG
jgi:ABC-type Fe3+/spermidine/putrescine transport system ATPase subunit